MTEEIFDQYAEGSIVTADYPTVDPAFENEAAHKGVESLKDLIRTVRNARAEVNVAPSKPITILVKTSDSDLKPSSTAMSTTSNASQIQRGLRLLQAL